ncbi:MAG: hypothetical protein KCHDKBKB_01847 [Elusimicrobia bacterium]|nr:hypothetical protein [Elusimicrobiota bacterium]
MRLRHNKITGIIKSPVFQASVVYLVSIIVVHWQMCRDLGHRIQAGSQVGALFIWEFWWFKKSLLTPELNPFYSTHLMFPVGIPVLPQGPLLNILALGLQVFFNVYTTYNLLCLFAYFLSGVSMFLLVKDITSQNKAAFLSGYIYMFSQYALVQHSLGHLNQSMIGFAPLIFLSLRRLANSKNGSTVLFFWSSLATSLLSPYFIVGTIFFGVLIFSGALLLKNNIKDRKQYFLTLVSHLTLIAVIDIIFYWPIFIHASSLIGGNEMSSLSLLSFIDYPAWHPNDWIQHLRKFTSGLMDYELINSPGFVSRSSLALLAKPENLMGFFGISLWGLVIWGWKKKVYTWTSPWLWLCLCGLVLAMGPLLNIAYQPTQIPLPFALFQMIPFSNIFRSPARLVHISWLGIAVLAGMSFSCVANSYFKTRTGQSVFCFIFLMIYSWEMGLHRVGNIYTTLLENSSVEYLKNDPNAGAVLDLPAMILKSGDISLNVQRAMLYQPLHGRPLVVGRGSRHTQTSLSFCENTEVIYELTHPFVLVELYRQTMLENHRKKLIDQARSIFLENNIRYIILRKDDQTFGVEVLALYEKFLRESLGNPSFEAGEILIFKI